MDPLSTVAAFEAAEPQRAWFEAFTPGSRLWEFNINPRSAIRLLDVKPSPFLSSSFRKLRSLTNHHLPSYHLPISSCDELENLLRTAQTEIGWHLLELDLVPENSVTHRLLEELKSRGWKLDLRPWQIAAVADIQDGAETYRRNLSKSFRQGIERNERRLSRLGNLRFDDVSAAPDWERWLNAAFELEEKGWKGQAGTAISQSPETRTFYTNVMRYFRNHQRFFFYVLCLDDRLIAFNLGVMQDDVAVGWKTSFDPDFARHSPGSVLQLMTIEQLAKKPEINKVDFMYPVTDWKSRWTTRNEARLRATIYADKPMMRMAFTLQQAAKRIYFRHTRGAQ